MEKRDLVSIREAYPDPVKYAEVINEVCRELGEETMAFHHSLGNPIYYTSPEHPGGIIKHMANGERYLIKSTPNRVDKIIRKL